MNLFSFSLYGDLPKYNLGAIENAKLISQLGTGWNSIFYFDESVPSRTIQKLNDLGSITRRFEKDWHKNGMFWRFRVTREFSFDRVLIRDVDSRVSNREYSAIKSWIDSNRNFHIMRDHPYHRTPILGGMWGATSKIKDSEIIWEHENEYGNAHGEDQRFLREHLYPIVRGDALVHDSFFRFEKDRLPFPSQRVDAEYVGESVDGNGNYDKVLRAKIIEIEKNPIKRLYLKRPQINS